MPVRRYFDPALIVCLLLIAFVARLRHADAVSALCLMIAGGGMTLFCQRRSGHLGALIAGLVYACAPFMLATVGAGRETLALALLPVMLWRLDALRDKPTGSNSLLATIAAAALLAAHATALWLCGFAALWISLEMVIQRVNRESSRLRARPSLLALLAILLGALMALPFVQSPPPPASGDMLPLAELLAAPLSLDSPRLGIAQWILALAGALTGFALYLRGYRTRHPNTFLGVFFCAIAALLLLAFAQSFALLALCSAVTASLNGIWLIKLDKRIQASGIALAVALPAISILPLDSVAPADNWAHSLDMLLALDSRIMVAVLALLAAVVISLRTGKPDLAPRLYWTTPPMTRTTLIGALAGVALAVCAALILPLATG